jgi:hypothetical protein
MSVKHCDDCGRLVILAQDRLGKWYALDQGAKAYGIAPHGRIGLEKKTLILHDSVCPVKVLKRSQEPQPPEQRDLLVDWPAEKERYP